MAAGRPGGASGFCVLRIKARGQRDLITVVGYPASINAGEWVQTRGSWMNDPTPWPAVQGNISQGQTAHNISLNQVHKKLSSALGNAA
jgi:exodeoxyribonuclease V alpha subunit